ncbi:hypothetical protein ABLN87_15435 [Ruegeria sp. SCPT10]|uniref:hypothetical protein n=1 Tax=Ruegeria sp. SCP10 TaxID=3141377 RepID=UPI00333B266A
MSKRDSADQTTEFAFDVKPFSEQLHILKDKGARHVEPEEVAEEIRKHGLNAMPRELEAWLCNFLDGKIEKRGRKGLSDSEKLFKARRVRLIHSAIRAAWRGDSDVPDEVYELLNEVEPEFDDADAESVKAWKAVSYFFHGHCGHQKDLSNLAGEFAPSASK